MHSARYRFRDASGDRTPATPELRRGRRRRPTWPLDTRRPLIRTSVRLSVKSSAGTPTVSAPPRSKRQGGREKPGHPPGGHTARHAASAAPQHFIDRPTHASDRGHPPSPRPQAARWVSFSRSSSAGAWRRARRRPAEPRSTGQKKNGLAPRRQPAACCRVSDRGQKSMPPAPMPAGSFSSLGISLTSASVVSSRLATLAAFCSAVRVTLVGSITPASKRSVYSPVAAL